MLLVDSNVFIYARGRHERTEPCRALITAAPGHPEWVVPGLVLLELTHYYRDAGEYARAILRAIAPVETTVGGQPVVARRVIGNVDNSAHPAIKVDIKMAVIVPVQAKGPVPVLIMFGRGNMPDEPVWRFPGATEPAAPPSRTMMDNRIGFEGCSMSMTARRPSDAPLPTAMASCLP